MKTKKRLFLSPPKHPVGRTVTPNRTKNVAKRLSSTYQRPESSCQSAASEVFELR